MSFANDIVNGNYSAKKKKKNSTMAEQIINGDYVLPKKTIAPEPQKKNNNLLGGYINSVKSAFDMANPITNIIKTGTKASNDFVNSLKKGKVDIVNQDALKGGTSKGFDWMDLILVPGSTAVDAASNFMAGVENIAYNAGVLGAEGIATIEDLKGNKNYAKQIRENIGGKNENVNEYINKQLLFKNAADRFDQSSLLGNTSDEILQGAGYYGGMVGLQQIGVPWQVTAGVTSYGGALQEAYANDATATEAHVAALMSTAGEIASEYMSSGLKLPKTGVSLDKFQSKLVDKFGNKTAKAAMGFLMQIGGEGTEEVVSGLINSAAVGLTYGGDDEKSKWENLKNATGDYLKNQALKDFAMGAAVTAVTNGVNPQTYNNMKQGRNLVSGYTQNEQKIIDSEVEQRIQEAEKKGEKVKKSKIIEEVQEDFANGNISLEGLQRGINGQEYQNYRANEDSIKEIRNQLSDINKELNTNYKTKVSKMSPEYQNLLDQKQQLENQLKPLVENRKNLGNRAYTEVVNTLQNDAMAQRSIYEYEQGGVNYQYEKTDSMNDNEIGLKDSAVQARANNTTQFHKFVDGINKVQQSSKTGLKIRFTNTQDIKQKGIAGQITHTVQEGDTIESIAKEYGMTVKEFKELNGNVKLKTGENIKVYGFTEGLFDRDNNILYLNVDSNRALEEILGHELTHTLENTDDYKTLRELLYKQAKKKGILESERKRLESIYDADTDIDSELTAELASKLFADEKFIEQLGTKPSFRKTVMNFLDDMITAFKGTKEEKQLISLKRKYQKAFSNMNAEVEGEGIQHSKALNGYVPDININIDDELNKYSIKNYYNHDEVIAKVTKNLKKTYLSTNEISKPITNIDTGMEIEIRQGGIRETFGNPSYYDNLSLNDKKVKIASMSQIAKMIKYGEVRAPEAPNYHDANSKVTYAYLEHPITIDGKQYMVNMDIRKSPNGENRFYIHSLNIKKETDLSNSQSELLKDKSISSDRIPQTSKKVNVQRSLSKDNQGRNLTQEQQEYFKNVSPELIDRDGNLMTFYHGTESNVGLSEDERFTVFDRDRAGSHGTYYGAGFYFTPHMETAQDYAKSKGDVYEVYLNMTNPYIPTADTTNADGTVNFAPGFYEDFENRFKDDISLITDWKDLNRIQKGRAVRNILQDNGYDGVINGDTYVVFEPNQIKNVDNLNPTSNPDIRYSISRQDNQGRELSEQQLEYFKDSKVVDNEGRLLEVYHGTPNPGFTVFDPNRSSSNTMSGEYGLYFTDSKKFADDFSYERLESDSMFYDKRGKKGDIYSNYLNITNPLDFANLTQEQIEDLYNYASNMGQLDGKDAFVKNMLRWQEIGNHQLMKGNLNLKAIADNSPYDGIKAKLSVQGNENEYIVFNSNQIKNVDNTDPTTNPDIRYSISKQGKLQENGQDVTLETSNTGTTGSLMAIHNLGENKLNGILDLGGFPVPSIAVTNPSKINHNQFGEISILFDKSTIDPANRLNEVYDRDVWTPTFPTIEYDLNTKVIEKARKAVGGYGNSYLSNANSFLNNIEDKVNRQGLENVIEDLKDNKDFKYVYYKSLNPNFELLTKQDSQDLSTDYSNAMLEEFAKEYGEIPHWADATSEQRQDIVNKFGDKLIPYLEERANKIIAEEQAKENPRMFIIGMAQSSVENIKEKMGALGWQDKLLENLEKIQKQGTTRTVNDYEATSNFINQQINQQEYEKWIDDLFNGLVAKKGIYNGKEYLTPQGNRRTFNQLHEDYNLQNLVKILTAQKTVAGEQGFGAGSGFGTIQAQMNNQFQSIEDIRNAENRIVENAGEITNQYRELIGNDMEQLGEYLKYKSEYSYLYDSAGTALNDFAGYKNLNMANLNKALENNNIDSKKVPIELKQKIIDDITSLKDLPTDYFEAKPQRAVGLNEIQQVVLPNTTTQETKQRLQDMGIEYTEYDPTIEGDRNRVINQFDELKWSMNRENIAPIRQRGLTYDANIREEIAPTYEDIIESIRMPNRTLNPLEISQLTPEDANTTPELPTRRYRTGSEQSSFFENVTETTKMLPEEARDLMRTEENIKYYDKITNEDSMNRALTRLNEGGAAETLRWFKADSKAADSTDVAEGWILMKQYSDNGDYSSMVEVAKKMRDIGTQAGQTVQAFNIMARLTPEGMVKYAQSELSEAYDQMVKNKTQKWIDENRDKFELTPDEVEFIMTTMEKVKDMEDGYEKKVELAKIQKIMTDKLPPQKGQGIKGWMRISMLFNPKTQVRNVVGNALIMPVNSFGDLFASVADYAVARKTGVRTTGLTKVSALAKGGVEGFKQATNDFKLGINTKNMEGNRFEIGEGKSFRERTIIGKSLNRTEAMLNYVMDAGDRVFSQAAYENSIANQLKLNNTDTVTPEMIDIAIEESLSRTWNDNNNYTRFVLNVRKGLNAINIRGYGLGDVLIPFAKTPANLTKAIVDYSPVGLVNTIVQGYNLRNNLQTETWTAQQQHQFVQTLGKATAGSILYVLAYALAKAGIATGASDDDKDAKDFLKNTLGISGYSIKIGDKSFTYDWAQPIAAPLAIMTNIENGKDAQGILEAVISSTDNASSVLMEQSFLQSINDVLNSQGSFTENLMDEILELPTRAVPTFVKQINDMVDGTQRQTFVKGKPLESAINKFKAKIPVLSQDLAPTVDTMGREVQKYGGKNNFFNVFLNPANVNTENISEEAAEIYRVYQQTGDKTIMPRVAPYYIDSKGERKILTTQERADFQKEAGEIIENGIKDFMNSSEYVVLSEEDKAKVIKNLIDYAYNKARKDVVGLPMSNTYNRVNKYLDNGGTAGEYYLNKDTIDDTYKWLDKNEDAKVALATVTTGDVFSYHKIYNDISTIKANTKQDKQEVLTYVQNLDLDVIQKAIIFKQYYSSFNDYNREIIQYVATSDLTMEQKYALLESMKFKVNKQTGTVSW